MRYQLRVNRWNPQLVDCLDRDDTIHFAATPEMGAAWLDEQAGPLYRATPELHAPNLRGLAVPKWRFDEFEEAERAVGSALAALRRIGTRRDELEHFFESGSSGETIVGPLQHQDRIERLEFLQKELAALRFALSARASGPGGGVSATA